MDIEKIVYCIVAILTGVASCVPLVLQLVKYVKKSVQEKNWAALVSLILKLMQEAEIMFKDGATKKEWVMAMVKSSAEYISYPIDTEALSKMIDAFCDMTNIINAPEEVREEAIKKFKETNNL